MTPKIMYVSINEIKYKARGHFFDPTSMRFFNSRIAQEGYTKEGHDKIYFLTSERMDHKSPRMYTIRALDKNTGMINTVEGFQRFKHRNTAHNNMIKLLKDV